MAPRTQYAKSGDLNIAYQVVGDGPFDLLWIPGFVSNAELIWEEPTAARFLERLASFSRLILFDKRGTPRPLGLEIRAGVHTGECEVSGDAVRGIAVRAAARVAAQVPAGVVLASSTVHDLVAGSGIQFAPGGNAELKGIGTWELYEVASI